MSVTAEALFAHPIPDVPCRVGYRDAALYALSVGYGADDLRHSYGPDLVLAPTLPNVVGHPGPWMQAAGVDWSGVVHAEQRLLLHRPLPLDTDLLCRSQMVSVVDKGAGKGMFATFSREIAAADGVPFATLLQTDACRFDGGCGSAGTPPQALLPPPQTPSDTVIEIRTRPDSALLYRLNGDLNPLHADPEVARAAGFPRPILHGLCTMGHVARAVCGLMAPGRLTALSCRFSAPVYPGETLSVEIWRSPEGARFRATAAERSLVVMTCGEATFAT